MISYEVCLSYLVIINDISYKVKGEQKIKSSEEKYLNILENMMDGYYETDLDGKLLYVNTAFCKILGYSKEELIGKDNQTFYDKHSRDILYNIFSQVYKTRTPRPPSGLVKLMTLKKKLIYLEGTVDLLYDSEGNKAGFYGVVRDITQRKIAEQKLKESEEKFRNIADNSVLGITMIQDGIYKYFNNRVNEISGYSAEDIKSWAPNEFAKTIYPEDREFVMTQARKKQTDDPNVVNQYSHRIIRKDGEIRWLEILSKTINYEGRPADLAMVIDITDKIKAERQLRDSEEKFSKAFNSNILSMSISSFEDGKFIEVNDAFLKFLGRSREEVIGKTTDELGLWVNEKVRKRFLRIIDKHGSLFNIETKDIPRTGEPKYGLVSYIKIILNEKPFLLSILNNITPRKLAEQQLKESEEKFRYIADHSLLGITILQDGVLKYYNKKVAETFGVSEEEIKNWGPGESLKLIHPDDRDIVRRQAIKVQNGEFDDVLNYKYRIVKKDGKIGWRETFSKSIIYEGHPAAFGIHIDITEKIEAEKKLKESKEKYLRAYNQAEFYKDLFIHDINNTLQSLYSSIQLIDMGLDGIRENNDTRELIDIMDRQIKRGIKLISNVRKLSQLEDHKISIEEVNVFKVLKRSIEFLKNSFQDRKIKIKCDTINKKSLLLGNDLLQDVFENILINSVRHNKNDVVEIIIRTSQVDQDGTTYCKLEFIDNGIGIEDERKESVLTRGDPNSKTTYGMGLGLSLVKKIIETYGGKIWIEDKVKGDYSKGTNVILLVQKGGY
ncbi:MAG: PAS domain S-box protein [Promethearchaeota archaeon]